MHEEKHLVMLIAHLPSGVEHEEPTFHMTVMRSV